MFSLMDGRELSVAMMAKLMGHDLEEKTLNLTSERHMRHMLGMSVHVAVAGYVLVGLLASLSCVDC